MLSVNKGIAVHIGWITLWDMPEVLRIENQSFEFPWYKEEFVSFLCRRNCIGMVAEHGERVVGFMLYELQRRTMRLINLAVDADFRRKRVGHQLVDKLIRKLSHQRRDRISVEVRETNLDAQLFFRAEGFRAISVLRDFYDDTEEDAYSMQYWLSHSGGGYNRISRLVG